MREDIIREREKKLDYYEQTESAFPASVKLSHRVSDVLDNFTELLSTEKKVQIAGRIFALRDQGKIIFVDIKDGDSKIQIIIKEETKNRPLLKDSVDVGDFISVKGTPFITKRGEKSVVAQMVHIVSKSIRPMPSSWYGIEDIETKYRKRYLDILLNDDVKDIFRKKEIFWDTIRNFLKENNFFEIQMPVLEPVPGGAEAEPFITHHNALDRDFYLRISLELPLKKMLVAGFDSIFEIGRIFRNEGIDREHLQDYTQMECYRSFWDYNDMMKFVESMYKKVIKAVFGTLSLSHGGSKISWAGKWPTVDYFDIFKKKTGIDLSVATNEMLIKKAAEFGIPVENNLGKGRIIDLIYKKMVRPTLIKPCFLINPPVEVEPLAKRMPSDPNRVERFQILAYGTELGKGFSELNDPRDQRKRFEEQAKLRSEGDSEAQRMDEDFIEALEYGMPPAAGFGVSERLFSVLMEKPIREIVVFPLVREDNK